MLTCSKAKWRVPVLSKILAGMSACLISHVTLLSSLVIIHVTYLKLIHKHSIHVCQSNTYATAIIQYTNNITHYIKMWQNEKFSGQFDQILLYIKNLGLTGKSGGFLGMSRQFKFVLLRPL